MKKCFFITLICLLFSLNLTVHAQINAQINTNHWAYSNFSKAIAQKWLDYTSENFEPNSITTRAEFIKMLEKAFKLMPGSNNAKLMQQISANKNAEPFTDTSTHWVSKEGWLKAALNFGLVIPSDYGNNKFGPDTPISRRECAVMITRALGRVYPATQYSQGNALFTDWSILPAWVKGYINELVNYKILRGYPDGSLRSNNNITNAEAVSIISRAVDEMSQGVDSNIKVFVRKPSDYYPNDTPQQVDLAVPAQMINKCVYVPVRSIYEAVSKRLYPGTVGLLYWSPAKQTLSFEYGMMRMFQAGDERYGINGLNQYSPKFLTETRLLNGELMIPAYNPAQPSLMNLWSNPIWEPTTKTLTIPIYEVKTGE